MEPITHVIAGIDFSAWTSGVLHTAAELASQYRAKLTVVYAESFLPPPYFTKGELKQVQDALAMQRVRAEAVLHQTIRDEIGSGAHVDAQLVDGLPVDAILQTADAVGAGLIVLGTHGRSGLNRLLMGSVAEKVVRLARIPVLTVRADGGMDHVPRLPFRTILCPVNFTDLAHNAMGYAIDLAQRFHSRLIALASLENGQRPDDLKSLEAQLCAWVPEQVNCRVTPVVRSGNAAEQILKTAREEAVDLIVQGARHRPLLEATILGTTSVRVMRHAACPVLTVLQH